MTTIAVASAVVLAWFGVRAWQANRRINALIAQDVPPRGDEVQP